VFFEAPNHFGVNWAGFWVFSMLLVVLQLLHMFWFYLIAKMIYRLLSTGIEKDERSDDEEEVADEYASSSARRSSRTSRSNGSSGSSSIAKKKAT
jgi:hypothetical protein